MFRPWVAALGDEVDVWAVCLPGRDRRFGEAPQRDFDAVVEQVAGEAAAVGPWDGFFGHSLGGALAYEVTRALRRAGAAEPARLVVAGARPPGRRVLDGPLHLLSDEALKARLKAWGGTPPEVLAHDELMGVLLPVLRADFALADSYTFREGQRPTAPLAVWGGRDDPELPEPLLREWRGYGEGPFESRLFDGGHFFLDSHRAEVSAAVRAALR